MKRMLLAILLLSCAFAGNASVQVSAPSSILLGASGGSIPLLVKVLNPDGTPASGVGVTIRIIDSDGSGILGSRSYADIMKMSDSSGSVSGTINLPPPASSAQYRNGFPINLRIEAYSYKHDPLNEWAAKGTTNVKVESAAPLISSVSASPNPAQSGQTSQATIQIIDIDSAEVTANLSASGGGWNYSQSALTSGQSYPFGGSQKTISIPWIAPKRGMNAQEVALARALSGQLESVTLSCASAQSSAVSSKYTTRLGTFVAGLAPVIPYSGQITQDQLPENADAKAAYSKAGISISRINYNLGFLVLQAEGSQAISALGNSNSNLADALSGSISKRLSSIPASYSYQTYILSINASDEGGLYYYYAYPLRMEHSGFKG